MTDIEFQVQVEARRAQALVNPAPSVVLEDEYDYPFVIAAVPSVGPRGDTGPTGPTGPAPEPFNEVLQGTQNGVNASFQLTYSCLPNSLRVYRNGLLETVSVGYSLAGTTLTFTTPPLATDLVTVTYYIQT